MKRMRANSRSGPRIPPALSKGRLREEIATLEKRLQQIGPDGDCGYEKALIRFFEQQLGMRREQLQRAK